MATDEEPEVRKLIGTESPEVIELEVDDLSKDIDEIDYNKYVYDEPSNIKYYVIFLLFWWILMIIGTSGTEKILSLTIGPLYFVTFYSYKKERTNRVKKRIKRAKECDHENYNDKLVCVSCGLADSNLELSLRRIETSNADSFKFYVGSDIWKIGEEVRIISGGETEVLGLYEVELTSIGDKKKAKLMGKNPRMEPIRSSNRAKRISKALDKMRTRYGQS